MYKKIEACFISPKQKSMKKSEVGGGEGLVDPDS